MMEPRLVVFYDDTKGRLQQIFLCAENDVVMEVPGTKLVEGFTHLMAMYYVFDVQYPSSCKATLFFLQDVLMGKPDHSKRPTRYTTYNFP